MTRDRATEGELESLVAAVVREQLGAAIARIEPLAGALGRRRFARVWLERGAAGPNSLIARVEAPEDPERRPAGVPPEPPLEPLRALLQREDLPVPARHGGDPERGVELLEDLGERSLTEAAATASPEELDAYYTEACNLVPRLQRVEPADGVAAFDRRLNDAQFAYKAERFARWSLSRGESPNPTVSVVVGDAFGWIAQEAQAAPQRLAHRDLQSANLYVAAADRVGPGRPGDRLVMIDLQGAFMAPPEYDLVCLLRDSYVELSDDQVAAQLARILPSLPDAPDTETSEHRFDLLTLSRKGKDHALYCYAAEALGDSRYLEYVPVARRALVAAATRVAARDPRFEPLAELIHSLPESPCAR